GRVAAGRHLLGLSRRWGRQDPVPDGRGGKGASQPAARRGSRFVDEI
ncbi:MAG: hypothetical protein AVDCRST_MAG45-2365, partial [uncultured Solirubrobacterales bacterium]